MNPNFPAKHNPMEPITLTDNPSRITSTRCFQNAASLAVLLLMTCLTAVNAGEIHVSPAGNDSNPGTAAKPLASVSAAQTMARAAAGKDAVNVLLHKGVYYLPETLRFTPEDSGCTYAAVPGESVVISGGLRLALKWEPFRDGIMQAKTPSGMTIDQLFVNGVSQHMARYPNYDPGVLPFGGVAADAVSAERAARWANPAGGFIHAGHKAGWGGYHFRITGKDDKGEPTYEGGWQNNRPSPMHEKNRFVENIFEELDAPGEWFHDVKTDTLYYMPPADVDLKTATIEVDRLGTLVELNGTMEKPVKNITLRGIVFRHSRRTFMDTKEPLLRSDWAIYRGGAVFFNGAEDCAVIDCEFDQLGGNAVFVNNYNRRITIKGCDFHDTGASAVAFVGDPGAVRNPVLQYGQSFKYAALDKTPGPKSENYPKDCTVEDCLIRNVGTVEKQVAGVQISMSMGITVRHCSIYETARAGINVGEGAFGGHLIEFCDVFDTVRETHDHGSFNSWGRDRYWKLGGPTAEELPALAMLDMVKPNIIRNSRWLCKHGWDVDLDDGSSNYEIYNNLFLWGGLKLREGFHRKVWNNITINNSLHAHAWYDNSGDEVTRNIWMGAYKPALIKAQKWGKEVDRNLFTTSEEDRTKFADQGCDANSLTGDPMFVDAAKGDFRVKDGSPALKLGFVNFPMDKFGVTSPRLRAIARVPEIPSIKAGGTGPKQVAKETEWQGAKLREMQGAEFSALGVAADAKGVLVTEVAKDSPAFQDGMRKTDFIQRVENQEVSNVREFLDALGKLPAGGSVKLTVIRGQESLQYTVRTSPNKSGG